MIICCTATRTIPIFLSTTNLRGRRRPIIASYGEVQSALKGWADTAVSDYSEHWRLLNVVVPVQHYKKVVGALMVSSTTDAFDGALLHVRLTIFLLFVGTAVVTVLLSLYLAGTIVRPLVRLARAVPERGRNE
ncbi:MAG: two-component system OmpR family sensor histidine kinase ChvG [Rhodospirillaceae bacterium]|nr:MAG: two-component system OmpR family sensor histidine kinase ChvG [Rhodospirillaceae bacterium]